MRTEWHWYDSPFWTIFQVIAFSVFIVIGVISLVSWMIGRCF